MPFDALGRLNPTKSDYLDHLGYVPLVVEKLGSDEPLYGTKPVFPITIPYVEKASSALGPDGANGANISLRGDYETAHAKARGYPRPLPSSVIHASQVAVRQARAEGYRTGRANPSRTIPLARRALLNTLRKGEQ